MSNSLAHADTLPPGILLDYCRRRSQTAKRADSGNPWGYFVGCLLCVRGQSIALFALYCKKLNFLRDIRDFDSYISYKGFFAFWRKMSKFLERSRTVVLFVLSCKKLNFLRDIRDFDSYISYKGFFTLIQFPTHLPQTASVLAPAPAVSVQPAAVLRL